MNSRALVALLTGCLLGAGVITAAEQRQAVADYAGRWITADPETRYITQIEIKPTPSTSEAVRVHVWGKCEPRDCDWGTAVGGFRKGRLSAVWKQGDGLLKQELTIDADGRLKLQTEAKFSDRAGHHAQRSVSYFVRERAPQ